MDIKKILDSRDYILKEVIDVDKYKVSKKNIPSNMFFLKMDVLESKEHIVLLELSNIIGIPKLIETFIHDKNRFIISEYIIGEELESLLENNLSIDVKTNLFNQIIDIIKNIHNRDWIHADIHTNNIIITSDLKVYIVDFGSSVRPNTNIFPLFPPPESLILNNKNNKYMIDSEYKSNVKTDYWSLGILAIRLFTEDDIPTASNFMLDHYSADDIKKLYSNYKYKMELPDYINKVISGLLQHNNRKLIN